LIKSLSHQTTDQKYYPLSLHLAKKSIYTLRQGPYTSNAQLFEKIKARVEIVEEIRGSIGNETDLVKNELKAYLSEQGIAAADAKGGDT